MNSDLLRRISRFARSGRRTQLGLLAVLLTASAVFARSAGTGGAGEFRIQYALALVAWLLFAAVIHTRYTSGWRGRKPAILTICGFASAIAVLGVYLLR